MREMAGHSSPRKIYVANSPETGVSVKQLLAYVIAEANLLHQIPLVTPVITVCQLTEDSDSILATQSKPFCKAL